jgi:hypothetical protein
VDLARLAMAAADAEGLDELHSWPSLEKGGIGFGGLPPFLPWRGRFNETWHLVLLQARELGSLVPGSHIAPLPEDWLEDLVLADLARPFGLHPDFPGGVALHVVACLGPGRARVRSTRSPASELVRAVLEKLTGKANWWICQSS